jgi:hypothetical protein
VLLASSGSALLPGANAQSRPVESAAPDSFIALSKILTGQASLDGALASRLYEALSADDVRFNERHRQLLAYIDERNVDPARLQQLLDADKSPLAALPRRVVSAWYTGIVGDGERARCIAFEKNLLNVVTADKLKPPSYSYGVYGSWAAKPV